MSNNMRNVYILCMTLLVLIVGIICVRKLSHDAENFLNISHRKQANGIKWTTCNKCKYKTIPLYTDVLKDHSINKNMIQTDNWDLYIPCSYNDIQREIENINPTSFQQKIFIIGNPNAIASKSDLWLNLIKKYGHDETVKMMPKTYVLYKPNDIETFKKEYDKSKIYIMKKNIQRQEGIKITREKNEIINGHVDKYVVVQELLQNPYLINGRKINLRMYVLFVCKNNNMSVYVHDDGFVYYTKMPFEKNSLELGPNITTGYIDRWVYHINPLTHYDLRTYLDNNTRDLIEPEMIIRRSNKKVSDIIFERIYSLIKTIALSVDTTICASAKLSPYYSFQLFGADIAIDEQLTPKIMEFNIGPNLDTHDTRDREVKYKVVTDILKIVGIIPSVTNGFIQLI